MELTYDSYLEHYGVKGMKWGVRKDDDSSSSKKPSYSVDSSGRISIDKGYELQRIFHSKHNQSGSEGTNYFSFTEKDKHIYTSMMSAGIDSRFKFIQKLAADKMSVLVSKEELKSPSRKEAFDILKSTIDEVGTSGKIKKFDKDFSDRGALEWYQEANARTVLNRDTELYSTYSKNLRNMVLTFC